MNSSAACLLQSTIFNGLDAPDMDTLVPLFSLRTIMPGEVLAQTGDTTQFFFFLETGTLLVALDEGRAVVLNSPGDFAGFSMVSRDSQNSATITVLEKGVVWDIACKDLLDLIAYDTPAAAVIMDGWQRFIADKAPFCPDGVRTGIV